MKKENKKQPTKRFFFWEIPGDVPGYRTQPDPFQSNRSSPNSDYQLPPHLDTKEPDTSSDNNGFVETGVKSEASEAVSSDQLKNASKSVTMSNKKRYSLLVLAIILLAGLAGYYIPIDNTGIKNLPATLHTKPVADIALDNDLVEPAREPKVFELILGEDSITPESKLRIITHVVVKGDTLWDIAEKYVKDPFRYPELAELSKIKNPDLIYPYDLVRIRIYE